MKVLLAVGVLFLFLSCAVLVSTSPIANSSPAELEDGTNQTSEHEMEQVELDGEPQIERGGRFRRATCDLLSFTTKWFKVNHAACAAHCIGMRKGYKGGHCKGTVCHCRR